MSAFQCTSDPGTDLANKERPGGHRFMFIALIASLALAAVAHPVTPVSEDTRYVAADVLMLRTSPEATGDTVGRVLINTPLIVVGERAGYVEVRAPAETALALGYPGYHAQPRVWVSAAHLADAPITAHDARTAYQRAVDNDDAEGAITWAERVVAIEGRVPKALTLLAQATGLGGDDERRERLHTEMEQGRTLVGACSDTGAFLIGELFSDGRFVSAVHSYPDSWAEQMVRPSDTKTRRAHRRLSRLAREVASMRFFAASDGRLLSGSPFATAQVLGLESSVLADETDLTYGLKVGMGPCPQAMEGSVFASRPLTPVEVADVGPPRLTPERSAQLIKSVADKVNEPIHKDLGDVLTRADLTAVPGDPTDKTARVVRRAVFNRGGHYEPFILTRWGLLDADDRVLIELDVPGPTYRPTPPATWFQAGNRRFVLLNWGGEMQGGVQAVFLDDEGEIEHHVMPSIVASGC